MSLRAGLPDFVYFGMFFIESSWQPGLLRKHFQKEISLTCVTAVMAYHARLEENPLNVGHDVRGLRRRTFTQIFFLATTIKHSILCHLTPVGLYFPDCIRFPAAK